MITNPINVTKDVYRKYLVEKLPPAIKEKWRFGHDLLLPIYIQQDNAKPHINSDDHIFMEAARSLISENLDIRLRFQPANSPDLNVLDLGFFRAIQSLQHQWAAKNVGELISAVEESIKTISAESLNAVFITLQGCMLESMKRNGGDDYKIPHIGKKKLQKLGTLPEALTCDKYVIEQALHELLETQ